MATIAIYHAHHEETHDECGCSTCVKIREYLAQEAQPQEIALPELMVRRVALPRCRVCGCTEVDACPGGCSWADETLCDLCHETVQALVRWTQDARRSNLTGLKREFERQLGATRPAIALTAGGGR